MAISMSCVFKKKNEKESCKFILFTRSTGHHDLSSLWVGRWWRGRGGGASTPVALLLPMGLRRNKNKEGWDLNSKRLTTGKRRKKQVLTNR